MIVAVQLVPLGYGATTLWHGRPLYYAFSVNCLQVVQASDIDPNAARRRARAELGLAPHWYSLPRWIWAPFPKDAALADQNLSGRDAGRLRHHRVSAVLQELAGGAPELRAQLQKVSDNRFFYCEAKGAAREAHAGGGLPTDQANGIALTGRGSSLLAVMDPAT